jgi:ElaB/YqjD/DUF883 family membrane-anchored ribosome-binding protein
MPADAIVEGELKALSDELSRAAGASPAPQTQPTPREQEELGTLLTNLTEEAAQFLEEAEKDLAAHPLASIGSALVVGLVIGLLLGRR